MGVEVVGTALQLSSWWFWDCCEGLLCCEEDVICDIAASRLRMAYGNTEMVQAKLTCRETSYKQEAHQSVPGLL